MSHAQSHFQPIAELPSEYGMTVWGFATRKAEDAVRQPGFFQPYGHHLADGDLLLVRHTGEAAPSRAAVPTLALFAVDRDAAGRVVVHPVWRFNLAEARAAAQPANAPAAKAKRGRADAG
jgi:hypothetical protein